MCILASSRCTKKRKKDTEKNKLNGKPNKSVKAGEEGKRKTNKMYNYIGRYATARPYKFQ
jgi:hypothetical protein